MTFLLHDATLERTTNGQGRADALTWRELALLDAGGWHSAAFAGEPVASLAAIAALLPVPTTSTINIEIKPTPGRERETGAAVALDAARLWQGAALPPLLSSFAEASLQAARETRRRRCRAPWLVEALPADWLARCRDLGCAAIDASHRHLDRAAVDAAHTAGLAVATWTVNVWCAPGSCSVGASTR